VVQGQILLLIQAAWPAPTTPASDVNQSTGAGLVPRGLVLQYNNFQVIAGSNL